MSVRFSISEQRSFIPHTQRCQDLTVFGRLQVPFIDSSENLTACEAPVSVRFSISEQRSFMPHTQRCQDLTAFGRLQVAFIDSGENLKGLPCEYDCQSSDE